MDNCLSKMYYPAIIAFTFILSLVAALAVLFFKSGAEPYRPPAIYMKIRKNIIWILVLLYFLVFSWLSIIKFKAYNMAMIDLGRMDQAIWNTLHGRFLVSTFEFGNACRMIAHSELIYVLIAPLYLVYPDPKTLLILQTLVISLGALPIYGMARKKMGGYFAPLCFSYAYLLYPSLQYGNLIDFHPDMLATTFLLFTFYYLERKNWFKYFIFLLLSLICKEYVSLILIMLGIYVLFKEKNIKISIITILLGISWFFMTYKIIPGLLTGGKENMMAEFYGHVGSGINQIFKNIINHPIKTIADNLTLQELSTAMLLLLPLGFLPLFNLPVLFIALPILTGLILTPFFSYANHHNGTIIPFIFISAIGSAGCLVNKFRYKFKNISYSLAVFIFLSSLLSNIFYGASVLSWRFWDYKNYRYWNNLHNYRITEHDKILDKFVSLIPPGAAVSSSNHIGSHLSHRETIYHFPYPKNFDRIDYILVDLLEYFPPVWAPRQEEIGILRGLLTADNFTLLFSEDGILLLQNSSAKDKGYYLKATKVKEAPVQHLLNLSFDQRLMLIGYDLEYKYLKRQNKYRIVYYWRVLKGFDKQFSYEYFGSVENLKKEYILIDTFQNQDGKERFYLPHLPNYILYTPADWKEGDIIKEEFDFYVPSDIPAGNYIWKTGLYAVPDYFFIETNGRNLVPDTKQVTLGTIELK